MAKDIIQPVRGTRDFYPAEMAYRHWFKTILRNTIDMFGYSEYDGPVLERLELYAAKSGDELVKEQAFTFLDRGGEQVVMRPELTPTLARMVAARAMDLPKPIRWWSFGPMWRYERPQKGRSREFYQWNVDLVGVDTPEADAELLAIAATFFRNVGLGPDKIILNVNDRKLMEELVLEVGVAPDKISAMNRAIDRVDKMPRDKWIPYTQELASVTAETAEKILELLDQTDLWKRSERLTRVFAALEGLGVAEYAKYNPRIMRGLDYYTGTVFEAWDIDGEFRAILGGGRYGNLVADVGGREPLSGVGFGMGDMVIELVLQKFKVIPPLREKATTAIVTCFAAELFGESAKIAAELRAAGISTELAPGAYGKMDKQLKYANSSGAHFAVILGPDEAAQGKATLKDLRLGTQKTILRGELVQTVKGDSAD
jgi:histidyl-tRNA synthetase